ncbi:DUF2185 domain-containing protein [Myxococcus sp. NMCA1]|uniref:DUF2185 domain-containing protein n=1 Tax=Myxococcus sp. NMCA1 TaxID=2996785 RepID=UPI0022864176|nr:DUF2185 domain-containing protein [Myxococcus sp. NMCA1]WAM25302.1 DUF2185 domain-containing protein [Myxococcus sp. NMCA1]
MVKSAVTLAPVLLGEVDLPEGVLVILDPGLARFWRHDAEPASPRKKDPAQYDLRLTGADAAAAGRAYDREFDARFLFDRTDPEDAMAHFALLAREKGLDARAEVMPTRIPHAERARLAVEHGGGLGVVKYNGLWAVAAGGLPRERSLRVWGIPMPRGAFEGRWQSIDIVVDDTAEPVRSEEVAGVMVDHGQLLFAGLGPLGHFRMWEPLDGLADYVFRGEDAPALARELGASDFGNGLFGWKDLPMERVGEKATPLQARIEAESLAVGVDYRPHCNLERLNAQLRESPEDTGTLVLDGARVVGCGNRWGDGIFNVSRHLDARGHTVRIRVELGTEQRQKMMRRLQLLQRGAIVSRTILDDGEPIRFAERMKPHASEDSGWAFSSGVEDEAYMDEPSNFTVVPLRVLVARFKALEAILDAPVGALFRLEGERFVQE